jgi:hypothetical protein
MANLLFAVTYQVHKPDPNASDSIADLYRLAPAEAHVVAASQDQATLSAVITSNITLQPGEVFDILQVTQEPLGDKPLYQ